MSAKELTPKLQFPEFNSSSFHKVKLGEVTDYFKGFAFKSEDYKDVGIGSMRIVRVSDLSATSIKQNNLKIYFPEEKVQSVERYRIKSDDIIVTTVGSRPDLQESAVGRGIYIESNLHGFLNQNLLILRAKDNFVARFISYQINTNRYIDYIKSIQRGNANQANITVVDLLEYKVVVTSHAEQQKIAQFLTAVDSKISQLTEKNRLLKEYKTGVMQQLFSQQIRFKDDDGKAFPGWEEKHFGNVFDRIASKNKENNQNVLTISAQQGLISQLEYFNKSVSAKDVSGYYLLNKGDFAYNKSYSQGYPMGAIKLLKRYEKGVVSTLYICFRPKKGYCESFFDQYFDAGLLNREIAKIAQEGARNHGLLNVSVKEFFDDIKMYVPHLKEQQKIAAFLQSIDKKIDAVALQIEQTKLFKKGLLQQMFV